jgi:hypothetical protein
MGLAGNERCCWCSLSGLSYGISAGWNRTRDLRSGKPERRSTEVTDIFTTARPMLSHRPLMGTLGNRRSRLSVTTTQVPSLRTDPAPGRVQASPEVASRCVCQRRDSNPLFPRAKYPKSSPPAFWLSRELAANQITNKFCRGALNRAAVANPLGFALPSVSGLRLVPSGRPRACRHAPSGASPGIRVSRSGLRRDIFR